MIGLLKMTRFTFAALVLLLTSCSNSTDSGWNSINAQLKGLYVLNEGFFGTVNTSRLMVLENDSTVTDSIYLKVAGDYLGDVPNDITIFDKYLYIVVNNSHVIRVIDLSIMANVGDIALPGKSPREMVIEDFETAFVSCSDGTVAKIDLINRVMMDSYPVGNSPEGIVVTDNRVIVACSGWGSDNRIFVLNSTNGEVEKVLYAEKNVVSLALSGEKLYAGAIGGWGGLSLNPFLFEYDLNTLQKTDSVAIPNSATQLQIADGRLIFNNGKIFELPLENIHMEPQKLVEESDWVIYGFYLDGRQHLWTAEFPAINFAANGRVVKRDLNGSLLNVQSVGIGPKAMIYVGD